MGQDPGCPHSSPHCLSTKSHHQQQMHPKTFTTINHHLSSPTTPSKQLEQKLKIFKHNLIKNKKYKNNDQITKSISTSNDNFTSKTYKKLQSTDSPINTSCFSTSDTNFTSKTYKNLQSTDFPINISCQTSKNI